MPVADYKTQSNDKVELVNRNKEIEGRVLQVINDLMITEGVDKRWLAIGRTHVEQGFIAVNRAGFPARSRDAV